MGSNIKRAFLASLIVLANCEAAAAVAYHLPFQDIQIPAFNTAGPLTSGSTNTLTAIGSATAQAAFMCEVNSSDPTYRISGTKNLVSVTYSTNVRVNGTAPIITAIQGWSNTNALPGQPDGTTLGSGNASSSTALNSIANSSEVTTGTFTAPAVVTNGQKIAVVFSSPGWVSGTFNMLGLSNIMDVASHGGQFVTSTNGGTTWAAHFTLPNIRLNFDDGSTAACSSTQPFQTTTSHTYNSGSGTNEFGNTWTQLWDQTIDELCGTITVASVSSTFKIEVTDRTATPTQIAVTPTVDGHNARALNGSPTASCHPVNTTTLTHGHTYAIGVVPGTANNITVFGLQVGAALAWDASQGGGSQNYSLGTRTGSGIWGGAVATEHLDLSVGVNGVDDGTGSGAVAGGGMMLQGVGH